MHRCSCVGRYLRRVYARVRSSDEGDRASPAPSYMYIYNIIVDTDLRGETKNSAPRTKGVGTRAARAQQRERGTVSGYGNGGSRNATERAPLFFLRATRPFPLFHDDRFCERARCESAASRSEFLSEERASRLDLSHVRPVEDDALITLAARMLAGRTGRSLADLA